MKTHKHVVVVGSGASISQYRDQILSYVRDNKTVTLGINYMTNLCYPDYHLWTNRQRYSDLGQCIDPKKSKLLFGHGLPRSLISKHYKSDGYTVIYYADNGDSSMVAYDGKYLLGHFRTAGVLAVAVAHFLMKAQNIDIVGMDGYTMHNKSDLKNKSKSHHCYGAGHTDDASWEKCLKKDGQVSSNLDVMKESGIRFRILTPTKFEQHYDPSVLGVE